MFANGKELVDPMVFTSDPNTHELDLLMVAKAAPINAIHGVTGWVYDICTTQNSVDNVCMTGTDSSDLYGGSRIQLSAGDTLKVHFVNELPPVLDSKHSTDPGEQFLTQNPTNIHTHGMLVAPRYPGAANPTYGDNIFVLTFNSANGAPLITPSSHIHGAIDMDTTDYIINVPAYHPSGLFWFHPHAHGIALNQVSAGLSGIITVGQPSDYISHLSKDIAIRHLILKDTQVNGDTTLKDQEDPAFCTSTSTAGGVCNGGKWYFTVSGQLNPSITVDSPGQIWRITNASGSATYELQLTRSVNGKASSMTGMTMQLLSIDGISATPAVGQSKPNMVRIGGGKYMPVTCPGTSHNSNAVCINQLHMMPGSRAEVWVVNRDANGNMIKADGSQAILQTIGYSTGPAGDNWPAVNLAQVSFSGAGPLNRTPVLTVNDANHDSTGLNYAGIAKNLLAANKTVGIDRDCKPLPAGWKRRIFFGYPISTNFGVGFELLDEHGDVVPGTFQDVAAFPNATSTICLPLGFGNTPVYENWEIINLTGEDHNFHIHQTKFWLRTAAELVGTSTGVNEKGVLQDSVPLIAGSAGCDGTVGSWRSGGCAVTPVEVQIPFSIAGDFVYHCHILEHEDGGMMATIHVASSPK